MRRLALSLFFPFVFAVFAWGQQPSSTPLKVSTPEQLTLQQQSKQIDDRRKELRSTAKQVFEAEMSKEKSGDCPNATTTYDFNVCYSKAEMDTDKNFKAYEDTIRNIEGLPSPSSSSSPAPLFTPNQDTEDFDQMEQRWAAYRGVACMAFGHQWAGGSGKASAEMECNLRLTRAHMRELDYLYTTDLRL
jgi:uncharacterized protein YecT (DUF1311 family)